MKRHHKNTNSRYLDGEQLLRRATSKKGWQFKTDNKLRGAYGETDFEKKTVRVNKKKHTDKRYKAGPRNADGSASLLDTIVHELHHVKDPKAGERVVRKRAVRTVKRLSTRKKKKLYSMFQ